MKIWLKEVASWFHKQFLGPAEKDLMLTSKPKGMEAFHVMLIVLILYDPYMFIVNQVGNNDGQLLLKLKKFAIKCI